MIVASMCTIPERKDSFQLVLRRILHAQTCPVDQLHVWLNGYSKVPADFLIDPRLQFHLEPSNPGPWVRYRLSDDSHDADFFVTLDDDLDYPVDYIECGIKALQTRPDAAISFMGFRWDWLMPPQLWNYARGKISYDLASSNAYWQDLSLLAGCVSFFHRRDVAGIIQHALPGFQTNDDMMVSWGLQKRSVPIVCPPRAANWVRPLAQSDTPRALFRRDVGTRHIVFQQLVDDLGFDPTAGQAELDLSMRERLLVLSEFLPSISQIDHLINLYPQMAIHIVFPVPVSQVGNIRSNDRPNVHFHPVPHIDPGGRFDWFLPVHLWRNSVVARERQNLFRETVKYCRKQLNPVKEIRI